LTRALEQFLSCSYTHTQTHTLMLCKHVYPAVPFLDTSPYAHLCEQWTRLCIVSVCIQSC